MVMQEGVQQGQVGGMVREGCRGEGCGGEGCGGCVWTMGGGLWGVEYGGWTMGCVDRGGLVLGGLRVLVGEECNEWSGPCSRDRAVALWRVLTERRSY